MVLQATEPTEASFTLQPFDWEHQWYPVAIAGDLDTGRCVNRIRVLPFCILDVCAAV